MNERNDRPHPSGDDRYAIYVLERATVEEAVRNKGRSRLAETSEEGIGMTLRVLRNEGQLTGDDRVGILDRETGVWLINPWAVGR